MSDTIIHAVVVTYVPEISVLRDLVESLADQVDRIHLVDNTPADDARLDRFMQSGVPVGVGLNRLGGNFGIAKALNVGIEAAFAGGATHVLLSDQDSLPSNKMVAGLIGVMASIAAKNVRVGAVGPAFLERNTGLMLPFQANVAGQFFYGHVRPSAAIPVVEAITLITSGMLVPTAVLRDVGLMREDFFIDHVDIEWCHRARSRGWRLFGTVDGTMQHSMGERDALRVWYFGWRREAAYPPIRVYYRVRNYVALFREREIDFRWKIRNGWYTFGVVYSQAFFGKHGSKCLRMALRGFWDGLRNRMGKYEPA